MIFKGKERKKDVFPGNRNKFQGWIREKALSQNFSALFRINKRWHMISSRALLQ